MASFVQFVKTHSIIYRSHIVCGTVFVYSVLTNLLSLREKRSKNKWIKELIGSLLLFFVIKFHWNSVLKFKFQNIWVNLFLWIIWLHFGHEVISLKTNEKKCLFFYWIRHINQLNYQLVEMRSLFTELKAKWREKKNRFEIRWNWFGEIGIVKSSVWLKNWWEALDECHVLNISLYINFNSLRICVTFEQNWKNTVAEYEWRPALISPLCFLFHPHHVTHSWCPGNNDNNGNGRR